MNTKRLTKEFRKLLRDPHPQYSVALVTEGDLRHWQAEIKGPENTDYSGGMYYLDITFPEEYPMVPPQVLFLTPILHPNIDSAGRINLDILRGKWSPALQMSYVLLSVCMLLEEPNPDDPLVCELGELYRNDHKAYLKMVREHTRMHAIIAAKSYSIVSREGTKRMLTLMCLSRKVIRKNVHGMNTQAVNEGILTLPLPVSLKNYLMYCS